MPFRFYITDTFEGAIVGTNDESVATQFAEAEDFYVVDTQDGTWLIPDGEKRPVAAATDPSEATNDE